MPLSTQSSIHNIMLGKKVPHPASTRFDDELLPPAKRLRRSSTVDENHTDSQCASEDEDTNLYVPKTFRQEIPDSEEEDDSDPEVSRVRHVTELESALPPVSTDSESIAQYEAYQAGEGNISIGPQSRLNERKWTRGKSSIYVDAFNLALETVLEDESHLFDEKEMETFARWRKLEYEAQYL